MRRLLRIFDWSVTVLLALLIVTAVSLGVATRMSPDRLPTLFGHKVLNVLSGSMEPAIRTGDIIIVRPLQKGEPIHENDVITFRVPGDAKMLITHRVVGIVSVDGKPEAYVTKGDANENEDLSAVSPSQVLGRYRWRLPFLGYVMNFIRRPIGIVLVVICPGVILIGMELRRLWKLLDIDEANETKDKATPPLPPAQGQ